MYYLWIEALQKGIGAAIQRVQSIELHDEKDVEENECLHKNENSCVSKFNNNNKIQKIKMWEQILKISGNNMCADCRSPNPHWASINLGVILCIECSGVHRSLGVHYSKVRSLTLDDWEPEVIKVIAELGNTIVNTIYEANIPEGTQRASEHCTGAVREEWIKSKYVDKKFVNKLSQFKELQGSSQQACEANLNLVRKWGVRKVRRSTKSVDSRGIARKGNDATVISDEVLKKQKVKNDGYKNEKSSDMHDADADDDDSKNILLFGNDLQPANAIDFSSDQESTEGEESEYVGEEDISNLHSSLLLFKASAAHNLPVMCQAFAVGADKNWTNSDDRNRQPIHAAVLSGSVIACAYLLLNGAKINAQDQNGRTPLHLATKEGHTAQVCLFLKYKANQHIEDQKGNVPLSMAEQKEHADIVTLLRLGRLNEEMKDAESGISGDDMFNDVVRDFSRLAYSNLEKLQRPKNNE